MLQKQSESNRWYYISITDTASARKAALQGAQMAGVCAVATAIFSVFRWMGFGPGSYFDAIIFAVVGLGIYRMSRFAAVSGLVLYLIERAYGWATQGIGNPVLFVFFALAFINGVRGTFKYHKFAVQEGVEIDRLPWSTWGRRAAKLSLLLTVTAPTIATLLFFENKWHRSVLGRSTYKWGSQYIKDGVFVGPSNDWTISFKAAQLDWRKCYQIENPDFNGAGMFQGFPGGLLAIYEEPDPHSTWDDKYYLGAVIFNLRKEKSTNHIAGGVKIPKAVGQFMAFLDNGTQRSSGSPLMAVVLFRNSSKTVTLKFITYQPTDGTPIDEIKLKQDFNLIAQSFGFLKS